MNKFLKISLIILVIVLIIGVIAFFVIRGINNSNEANNYSSSGNENQNNKTKEEFVKVVEDGTKQNTSSKVGETKKLNGLEITNTKLTFKKDLGMTELVANVTNKTDKETPEMQVRVHLLNKDGSELDYMDGPISKLQPGETTQINIGITADFSNAYDFTIERL